MFASGAYLHPGATSQITLLRGTLGRKEGTYQQHAPWRVDSVTGVEGEQKQIRPCLGEFAVRLGRLGKKERVYHFFTANDVPGDELVTLPLLSYSPKDKQKYFTQM